MEKISAFCAAVLILFIALTGCYTNINGTDSPDESVTLSTPVEDEVLPIPPDTLAVSVECSDFVSFENTSWQVISIAPEDYGIVYDVDNMEFEQFPLDKLIAYYLSSDGAFAEGSCEVLYQRFLEAPITVLTYIALIGDSVVIKRLSGDIPARVSVCRAIAIADVVQHDVTDSFSAILEQLEEVYSSGSMAEVLMCLKDEHHAAIERAGLMNGLS